MTSGEYKLIDEHGGFGAFQKAVLEREETARRAAEGAPPDAPGFAKTTPPPQRKAAP